MNSRQGRNLATILLAVLLLASGFNNCGQRTRVSDKDSLLLANASIRGGGSTGGNPARTALRFGPYGRADFRPADPRFPADPGDGASPPPAFNPALLSFFSICASSIEFDPADGSEAFEVAFNRSILLLPDGTPISDFDLPLDQYHGIIIKLADTCGTGHSVEVTNLSGTFISTEETAMVFGGLFTSQRRDEVLTLDITQIAAALSVATSGDEIGRSIRDPGSVTIGGDEDPPPVGTGPIVGAGGIILPPGGIIVGH